MPRSEGISCSGGLITLQSSTTHGQPDTPVCIFSDEHRMLESRGDDGLSLLFSWSPWLSLQRSDHHQQQQHMYRPWQFNPQAQRRIQQGVYRWTSRSMASGLVLAGHVAL
jgi:hypothetical protein